MHKITTTIVAAAAALALTSCGGSDTAAEPEVVTETKTVTKRVVPDDCLKALTAAERANGHAATGFTAAGEAIVAAGSLDVAALNKATKKINRVQPKYAAELDKFVAAAEGCRAAAN